jgi:hypothetical protein
VLSYLRLAANGAIVLDPCLIQEQEDGGEGEKEDESQIIHGQSSPVRSNGRVNQGLMPDP